ncbi:MAG: hypothetical protein ACSLEN_12060 [Candidatus Malihini olakiniferum]
MRLVGVLPLNPQLPASLPSTLLPQLGVLHFLSISPTDDESPTVFNQLHYPDSVAAEALVERQLPAWKASRLLPLR